MPLPVGSVALGPTDALEPLLKPERWPVSSPSGWADLARRKTHFRRESIRRSL